MNSLNDDSSQKKLKSFAAGASVFVAALLCCLKAFAVFYTGSLSILSSLTDSLADIISSVISFIAIRFSNKPLTKSHRYGYGKAESVSALTQAAFIIGSAGFILYDGINRFIHPREIKQTLVGATIMFVSIVITLVLIAFQRYAIKKTKSLALKADTAHYLVDLLTNSAIFISLLVVHYFHWNQIDVLTALLTSFYLLWSAGQIALAALSELTDQEVPDDIRREITDIVSNMSEIKGYHDLRTRVSGMVMFAEIHLEIDGNLTLAQAHKIADKVEEKIVAKFPNTQVITHLDPYGLREKRLDYEINGMCRL